jgi:hypothetical protein
MAAYRDSIYDPLNGAGSSAVITLCYGSFAVAVGAAVRGGLTPEALLGRVAGIAAAWGSGVDAPCDVPDVRSAAVRFLDGEVEDGVPAVEAVGFLLSSTMDCACKASLDLRFAPRENKESLLEAGSNG